MLECEFTNLKDLSKNCSKEQIIALMVFYVMKSYNHNILIEEYSVFKNLNLNTKHYVTFITKLCKHYQEKIPIKIEM